MKTIFPQKLLSIVLRFCVFGLVAGLVLLPVRADVAPPFSGRKPPQPLPQPAPTAQARLEAAKTFLETAQTGLNKTTNGDYGEFIDQAKEDVGNALTKIRAALAYVKEHPEENKLKNGPSPAEDGLPKPVALPSTNRVPGVNILTAANALNAALNQLINNPATDYKGPILGDLGGSRAKIMTDIAGAATKVSSAIQHAAEVEAKRRQNPNSKTGGTLQFGQESAPTSAIGPEKAWPNIFASTALSLAFSLGGLHYFDRRRSSTRSQ